MNPASASAAWPVVGSFVGGFAAILAAGVAILPFWRSHQKTVDQRNERLDAASDAVLGVPADSNQGRPYPEPGLIHMIPLNGHKMEGVPTIMGQLAEVRTNAENSRIAAVTAADTMTGLLREHEDHDTERFASVETRLTMRPAKKATKAKKAVKKAPVKPRR